MTKIDCHMHVRGRRQPWSWDDDKRIIEAADKLGIDLLCASIPIAYRIPTMEEVRECNDDVLAAMQRFPDRIVGYCYICPGYRAAIDEIDRCLDQGMIGIKLYHQYKIWEPPVHVVLEKAIDAQVPILMHAGYPTTEEHWARQPKMSHAGDFVRSAQLYPEAMLIEAHVGGGGDWEWAIKQLREVPSVYLDTSGSVIDEGMVEMAARELGVERLLFGTDMTMEGGVGKVMGAALPASDKERIFWRNMRAILDQRQEE